MKNTILLLLALLSLKVYSQPIVSLSDTLIIASESDSLVNIKIRVINPDPNAFFKFSKDFLSSTVDHTLDYIDITGEVISASDTVIEFGVIILSDTISESPEELHFDLQKFYDSSVDTVNISGPTHFVLIINDSLNTGLEKLRESNYSVFPNPSNGLVKFEMEYKPSQILIYNQNGQIVNSSIIYLDKECLIDLSNSSNGIHYIHFVYGNMKIVRKVILRKE